MKNRWWGYLHINGTIQAKRFFSGLDVSEAMDSDFVLRVHGPFEAEGREEALKILSDHFMAKEAA